MDRDSLANLVAGLDPERLRALVDDLSPQEVAYLAEALPRTDVARDPAAGDPADFAAALDTSYRRRPHVDLLAAAIEQTVREGMDGTGPARLIVNMPPQVGKSWTSSLWAPAWYLERWPDRRVILASHEGNYAVSWGRKVRDTLREHGERRGALQVRISRASSAAGEWETTQGGGMLSRGIGGSITGRGAHLFIIDDPLKDFAAAHSAGVRKAQWEWWLSTAATRLQPGAAVVVVMTRWHEDDLAGRLTSAEHEGDPGDWRVLRIPAVGEGPVADVEAGAVAPDALDRAEGEPLLTASADETAEEATDRWARTRRQVGPYVWTGMYAQRPSEPEGTILRRAWWSYYRRDGDELVLPDGTRVDVRRLRLIQSWDMAFKDTASSSYVVGQVWGAAGGHGHRYLLDQIRDRLGFVETVRAMRRLRDRWPQTGATYVEDKANGPAIIAELRRDLSGLLPHTPRGSKEARAWSVQGDLESGSVWLPHPDDAEWVREFVEECAQFPNGAHDDQVDAFTQAMDRLRRSEGGEVGVPRGTVAGQGPRRLPTTTAKIRR